MGSKISHVKENEQPTNKHKKTANTEAMGSKQKSNQGLSKTTKCEGFLKKSPQDSNTCNSNNFKRNVEWTTKSLTRRRNKSQIAFTTN